jgi:hypothetical protein
MKRWALLVTFLYFLLIVALTLPVIVIAFSPNVDSTDFGSRIIIFTAWPYWIFVAVLVFSQASLLMIPVDIAGRRPITRRPLLLPITVTGFMMGALVIGGILSLNEFLTKGLFYELFTKGISSGSTWHFWTILAAGGLTWVMWTVVFYRLSRNENPTDVISRQCRSLLKGSILELLIAIPTHIVARSRDYCCAGFMTFIGITLGISVMLLSYGPGVFFLFLDRWNRLYNHRKFDGESTKPD